MARYPHFKKRKKEKEKEIFKKRKGKIFNK
jgi:hypothetical protein